jgi:hypothetical protein
MLLLFLNQLSTFVSLKIKFCRSGKLNVTTEVKNTSISANAYSPFLIIVR